MKIVDFFIIKEQAIGWTYQMQSTQLPLALILFLKSLDNIQSSVQEATTHNHYKGGFNSYRLN